jgi:cation/acetate symporter
MTGNPVPQLGMGGQVLGSDTYLLDKLNAFHDLGFSVYTNGTKSMVDVFAITPLMVGTAVTTRNCSFSRLKVKDARKSAGYALVLIAILYNCFHKTNLIETVNGKTILLCQLGLLNGKLQVY